MTTDDDYNFPTDDKPQIFALWEMIKRNKCDDIQSLMSSTSITCNTQSYEAYMYECTARMHGCACVTHTSIRSFLIFFPTGFEGFDVSITFDTIKFLFEIEFLKRDDIDFLAQYMLHTNCQQKFDILTGMVELFDKYLLHTYRSNDGQSILQIAFNIRHGHDRVVEWRKLMKYLIDTSNNDTPSPLCLDDNRDIIQALANKEINVTTLNQGWWSLDRYLHCFDELDI